MCLYDGAKRRGAAAELGTQRTSRLHPPPLTYYTIGIISFLQDKANKRMMCFERKH